MHIFFPILNLHIKTLILISKSLEQCFSTPSLQTQMNPRNAARFVIYILSLFLLPVCFFLMNSPY